MSLAALVYESGRLWKNASKSPERIQAESLAAFRKLLEHAWRKTRFYPAYWKKHGIRHDDLKTILPVDIPCITKDDVRSHFEEFSTATVNKGRDGEWITDSGAIIIHSSGSTGVPAQFLYGKHAMTIIEANFIRLSNLGGKNHVGWKDLPIRNIHAASVGEGYASTALLSGGLSKYHADSIILKVSEPLSRWGEMIGDYSPNYLSGYPSCLSLLLDLQSSGKIHLHPLKIISGGEPLKKDLKKDLQKTFDADVIDYYGCCESMLIGAGSSWYDGIYLFDDMNFCETDEQGHLILTPLYNPDFPLIRYKLDDLVAGFSKNHQGCLPFTHIDRVIGRDEDILWFNNVDGSPDCLHPLVIDELYADGLKAFQFVQIDNSGFRLDCMAESGEEVIKEQLQKQLDVILKAKRLDNLHYDICFRSSLQLNPQSGKIPLTIKNSLSPKNPRSAE